ncbi:hypothetical protein NDU88_006355 [Pleurodeles waltl]|uniref:Tyr recombinase domain-containing protein n=1 Tax=Pleurodeles waltl TaxID=8319 RepID=A0AAV7LRS3_PLEWA|nr:hypothetical protein NDU88_006355 [Pleurodeles waltl]
MPQWDLNLVLTFLMCAPFEPFHNCPLRLLTIKTAFLVAITSARRVSELQALSSKPPYLMIYPDKVVLRTRASFLPKVVTPFHLGQNITLPTFFAPPHPSKEEERPHRLDPKRALSFYLDRTKEFRVDDQLIVGYVGANKGRAVQKRSISRWVVLCIKICYALAKKQPPEGLRAHSTRGKAATTALARGVPVVDICQAATWASLHTFAKHYCLESQVRRERHFARSVLQDFLILKF